MPEIALWPVIAITDFVKIFARYSFVFVIVRPSAQFAFRVGVLAIVAIFALNMGGYRSAHFRFVFRVADNVSIIYTIIDLVHYYFSVTIVYTYYTAATLFGAAAAAATVVIIVVVVYT